MKKSVLFIFSVIILISISLVCWFALERGKKKNSTDGNINIRISSNFSDFKTNLEKLPEKQEEVSLIFVGDVMLSRNVASKIEKNKDPFYPFLKTKDYLETSDLLFGNLETSLTAGRAIQTGEMMFRADPDLAKTLKEVGFSILSLANNHTPNFGEKGLTDTFQNLAEAGIQYVGAGEDDRRAYQPIYLDSKGLKFAFLAYNDTDVVPDSYEAKTGHSGTAFMDTSKMSISVKEAKQNSDFVIMSMHSGTEYTLNPNNSQKNFAHAAIDAGADLVIGHHPHVVQVAENYKGKYIFYSLGNFIFDQMWSEDTRKGLMLKVFFNKDEIIKIESVPVKIYDYSQPKILEGAEKEEILKRLGLTL